MRDDRRRVPAHPVVAGDWLAGRLDGARGRVVGVGARAAYMAMTGPGGERWTLALESHRGVGLPCGIRLTAPDVDLPTRLVTDAGVAVDDGHVRVATGDPGGPLELAVVRWHRTRPTVAALPAAVVAARVAALVAPATGTTPDSPDDGGRTGPVAPWWSSSWPAPDPVLDRGAHDLVAIATSGAPDDAVVAVADHLLGHGPGSTPAGDDLLAGFLATCVVLDPVLAARVAPLATHVGRLAGARTTALSATLLACAAEGAMALPAAGFLRTLLAPQASPDRTTAAFGHLARVGHTSGHDLALGILAALVAHATASTSHRPTTRSA
jgi:hypothetical protein